MRSPIAYRTRHLALLGALLIGCGAAPRTIVLVSGPYEANALLTAHPPEVGRNITPILLEQSERTTQQLVWVRDREQPHVHKTHDLIVTILRGGGTMWLRDREIPMRVGDIAVVPAGTPHWFANGGDEPSAAFVVFAPPHDGGDNVPVTP